MTYVPGLKTANTSSITATGLEVSQNTTITGNVTLGTNTSNVCIISGTTTFNSELKLSSYLYVNNLNVAGNSSFGTITAANDNSVSSLSINSGSIFNSLNAGDIVHTSSINLNTSDVLLSATLQTIPLDKNSLYYITSKVIGKEASQSTVFVLNGLVKNIENIVTILTQSKSSILSELPSCDASLFLSATNLNISITGSSGKTINWKCASEIKKMQSI